MGEVYRARAYGAEGVVKDLCVKLIRAERLARPGAAARFVGEARVSMRLNHGNIVAVFDFGRSGESYYLAMEWIDGSDLRAVLTEVSRRAERLDPDVAAHVAAEVARALSYAHELREPVVHCDLKPENVLISAAGDVKLADFGLATVVRDCVSSGTAGTPGYMAPEQRDGGPLGPRTDLWALGVLLTELASGARDPAAIDDVELAAIARELMAESVVDRPAAAASVANRLEAFVARARADGSVAPREHLARLARRAPREGGDRARDLETTASFLRDGADDGFLRSMSMLSTVPPTTPDLVPAPPRASRAWPLAIALSLGVIAVASYGVGGIERRAAEASRRDADPVMQRHAGESPAPSMAAGERAEAPPPPAGAMESTRAPDERGGAPPPTVRAAARAQNARRRPRPAVAVAPTPAAPARISLNAVPWSDVEIDGAHVGVTPIFDHVLAPGVHRVRFTNAPLGAVVDRTIELRAGEAQRLVVDLSSARAPDGAP